MERSQWRKLFPTRILERGEEVYGRGAVKHLGAHGPTVRAQVLGHRRYQVEVSFSGELIEDWACDCPYGAGGTPCKHLAAVFLALEQTRPRDSQPLEALVAQLTPRQARALLLRLARADPAVGRRLRAEILRALGQPEP